jgi:hypothetical protein
MRRCIVFTAFLLGASACSSPKNTQHVHATQAAELADKETTAFQNKTH